MFRIGEFSRLSRVTVKTLRYYDRIGLLKPAKVDRFTSYRYYSAKQLPRLNRILALKDLGLSLDQVAELLESDLPSTQIRGMLRLKQVELQHQVQEERERLARVEHLLSRIEQEDNVPNQEVVLKKIPALAVASVRDVIPTYGDIGPLYEELFAHLGQHRISPAGPALSICHDQEYKERDVDMEAAVPVSGPVPAGDRAAGRELPAVEEMACIVHEGSYDTFGDTYSQLMSWIEANGYHISGPIREVYLRGVDSGGDPSTYITEIHAPVDRG